VGFARESLATNGFAPDQISLYRGIAASHSGFALFPRQDEAGVKWGRSVMRPWQPAVMTLFR
jgi:hypothetical protein